MHERLIAPLKQTFLKTIFLKIGILIFYIGCTFHVFYESCARETWSADRDWVAELFCCHADGRIVLNEAVRTPSKNWSRQCTPAITSAQSVRAKILNHYFCHGVRDIPEKFQAILYWQLFVFTKCVRCLRTHNLLVSCLSYAGQTRLNMEIAFNFLKFFQTRTVTPSLIR